MTTTSRKALFLDRDGTLTEPVWRPELGEWGPPWSPEELVLKPGAAELVRNAHALGLLVFVVTNQPDVAKGKADLAGILAVRDAFLAALQAAGAALDGYEHCLHHPQGAAPDYRFACTCRKPLTGMVDGPAAIYGIDRTRSWMVGDRASDILCGRSAGLRTIAVSEPHAGAPAAADAVADYSAESLRAVFAILKHHGARVKP